MMLPQIQQVIREWEKAGGPYSFETRIHPLAYPSQATERIPYVEMVFIIDVSGFFEDIEHTKPIKLHHERVISIDQHNSSTSYCKDLKKDLELFDKEAYAQFDAILSNWSERFYTN